MSNKLNTEKAYYEYYYDEIITPAELCGVHYKAAIQKRNRWLVDQTDYVIAFIYRDFGGAVETVKYARKQGYLWVSRRLDNMECMQLYFRGHTDAVAYLKKIKAI